MKQDRIKCNIAIDEYEKNVLIIKPFNLQDFKDDSIYEFKLPNIYSVDGQVIDSMKIKYVTSPKLAYASISDVKAKLGDIDICNEQILYHIREASRLAEIIIQKSYEKQGISFSKEDLMEYRGNIETMRDEHWTIWQFVVLKAAYETLLSLYIAMATKPERVKEMLSDLTKEVNYNLQWLKGLLDNLKKGYEEILEYFYTVADPKFALRGKTAIPIYPNMYAPYHRLNGMGGFGRGYNSNLFGSGYSFKGGGF